MWRKHGPSFNWRMALKLRGTPFGETMLPRCTLPRVDICTQTQVCSLDWHTSHDFHSLTVVAYPQITLVPRGRDCRTRLGMQGNLGLSLRCLGVIYCWPAGRTTYL